jgi:hypothetical protein
MPPNFVLLHGSLGLLDDGFFLLAVTLATLALACLAGYLLQARKQQTAAAIDSDRRTSD